MFNYADSNRDTVVEESEAKGFLNRVRLVDSKAGANYPEQVDRHWQVARLLSQPTTSMTAYDYFIIEQIMEAWYLAGKLEVTGSLNTLSL